MWNEDLSLTPQLLRARALRFRHLATKARAEAGRLAGDPSAARLIELAEKLERDAVRDEEEAAALAAEREATTPG